MRKACRISSVLLQGPFGDALLPVIGVLQMVDPPEETHVALDNGSESFIRIGLIAGNPGRELRHEAGMIELFFLVRAQVSLGAGHPKQVAMHDDATAP